MTPTDTPTGRSHDEQDMNQMQARTRRMTGTGLVLLAALQITGCGGSDLPDLGTVSGLVTLDGVPLPGATVTFAPAVGRPSQGITGDDGRFVLEYTAGHPGALLGKHVVRISTERYVEKPDGSVEEMKERVPAKYHANSTLEATVTAGVNDLPFALESK